MKIRAIVFTVIFMCVVMCSVIVAFCSGVPFGTPDFGWLVAGGMFIGGVVGTLAAGLPDYR
ncbi:hypothetical protein GECvBMG_gp032 [Salmonella phage GEC_vB_MG]|nr:hypothetical protein GECvBMG_gp032 [Salmonella phage GEC_vB_MG]WAK43522.1 hypothetical protein EspYZU15_22 [Cronobacter phage EspYZU15]WAK45427.1 hypothetical protein EspYZU14_23 [Cronobacter phage EspYZU14]WBF78211.1 hypothetical protein [Cronobacter phage EspYZU12]